MISDSDAVYRIVIGTSLTHENDDYDYEMNELTLSFVASNNQFSDEILNKYDFIPEHFCFDFFHGCNLVCLLQKVQKLFSMS